MTLLKDMQNYCGCGKEPESSKDQRQMIIKKDVLEKPMSFFFFSEFLWKQQFPHTLNDCYLITLSGLLSCLIAHMAESYLICTDLIDVH